MPCARSLPCPFGAPRRLPNHQMTNLHCLYARRAHGEFCEHAWGGPSLPRRPWPPHPGGLLQDSAKPSWSPISLSLPFPWRNKPALRQKVQGKQDGVLGAIRRHCCQTRLGAAHELTAANAIYKSNSFKTAAACGKSNIHSCRFISSLGLFFFFSQLSLHDRSLLLAQLRKKTQQCKRCKDKE